MSLSIFAQQIESMSRDKREFESKAQKKLTEALKSFIGETGIDTEEVSFKQGGISLEIGQLEVVARQFKFEWVIDISHDGYNLQAAVPVFALPVFSGNDEILFGIGEHVGNNLQDDPVFMKKLIVLLNQEIANAFP